MSFLGVKSKGWWKMISLKVLVWEDRSGGWLSTVHDAFRGSTRSAALEVSYTRLERSDFTKPSIGTLSIFFIVNLFFPFFPVYIILDKWAKNLLLVHVFGS